jgi:hypothetical protein
MWKVASSPMLKEHAFKGKTNWWVYKALRRLESEKYLVRLPRGRNIEQELWTLTDHGFEVFLMDRDDIKEYRYRVHAPAHDYLATCLQLGEIWQTQVEHRFFTEQMLASLAPSNFPKNFREVREHVPDGVTMFPGAVKNAIVGYEVDLNLKDDERYKHTFNYYQRGIQAHLVIWLVKSKWMAARIEEACLQYAWSGDVEAFRNRFAFVLVEDFKEKVWGAEVFAGSMKGVSLRKLHTNLLQTLGKTTPNIGQKPMREIFFPRFKSPQKSNAWEKGELLENH